MNWVQLFLSEFFYLLSEMAPWLLLGFLFAGILKAFFPSDRITRFMGKRTWRSTINAALLGVPMPLCSCGVIPTGISFFKNGATKGATTSFMISTPQTGVDSILATYALLGLPFAILRPIISFVTGVIGGSLNHITEKKQWAHSSGISHDLAVVEQKKPMMTRIGTIFKYGFGELVEDIVKWLIIGLLLASFLAVLIPDSFFTSFVGSPYLEMLMVLAASIPLYICATGSIPLAAVLLMKGLSPGAALVLLMAGPATNIATMVVIGNTMGRKSLLVYLFTIIGGAMLFGTLVNEFLPESLFLMDSMMDHSHSGLPDWIKVSSVIVLSGSMLLAVWNRYAKQFIIKKKESSMNQELYMEILVEGMTCHHCKAAVEKGLLALKDVDHVVADLSSGLVEINRMADNSEIEKTLTELGYKYIGEK